ncbi:RDD family protein [Streptomyces sp. NBC_00996]|uniref:RDD family protein n=1 Tax=Streptomyces sp. NBC_00996 TaxID=2903710 RepID=UPI00386A775D|nr:RDD family protein [Streptomyces sp. NBC_00996]
MGSRLGARLLDLVFWGAGYAVLGVPLAMWIDRTESEAPRLLIAVWLATSFTLYFPLCTARFGATLGKRICGVRVVRANSGERIGVWQALGREFFWLLAFPVPVLSLLNPLWCCWDKPLRQCLHDKVADTMTLDA